jgi:hypothetical protein
MERKLRDPLNWDGGSHHKGIARTVLWLRAQIRAQHLGDRILVFDNNTHYVTADILREFDSEQEGGGHASD